MEYKEEEIRKLRQCLLYIMRDIKRVCEEENLCYMLMYGSLIGAIRHKGFIPWDDDLDICMPRKDYERFMQIADTKLNDDLFVENYKNSKGYAHSFGKVMLKGTVWEENFTENVDCHKNVYVDIFPVDKIPDNKMKYRLQYVSCKIVQRMLLLNANYKYTKSGLKKYLYKIGYWLSGKFKKDTLINAWERNACRYNREVKGEYAVLCGIYKCGKEVFPTGSLDKFTEIPFEGEAFSIPSEYDLILKHIYGDYMKLPPASKQVSHHNLKRIDFGKW